MTIGGYLQALRFANDVSVGVLSEKSGCSVGSIRAYEQNRRTPSAKALRILLYCLHDSDSHWIDNTTWKDPFGTVYNLAPRNGGYASIDLIKPDRANEIRLETIQCILSADLDLLLAIKQIIVRKSQEKHTP